MALLRASLLARENRFKEAGSVLASVDETEGMTQELLLMRAQLAVYNANHSQVIASDMPRIACMQSSATRHYAGKETPLIHGFSVNGHKRS